MASTPGKDINSVSPGTTGFCWVLLGFIGFVGFHWVLLGFIGAAVSIVSGCKRNAA